MIGLKRLKLFLLSVGAAQVGFWIYRLFKVFKKFYLATKSPKNLLSRYAGMNQCWAVVTGGSSGVGFGFCRALAKRGFDICMISRSEDSLKHKCKELKEEFPNRQFLYVAADLGKICLKDDDMHVLYKSVSEKTGNGEIGALVLAAGGSDLARHFSDHPLKQNRDVMLLNTLATVAMVQTFLPKLIHRDCRSAVITCGAVTAFNGTPGFATSSANKSFVRAFTLAISKEYEQRLDIMCAHPLAVYSNIVKSSVQIPGVITADTFAEGICNRMGQEEPIRESFGTLLHDFIAYAGFILIQKLSPEGYLERAIGRIPRNSKLLDRPVSFEHIDKKVPKP